MSLATNSSGAVVSRQDFDPWGAIRSGDILQRYRYSNPTLSRFISAGSAGRGVPTGTMVGVALKPLTVDFHETGFVTGLNAEHGQGFWFQLSQRERQEVAPPWGPANPQGLNRYAYVQNNPLKYTDPTGHNPDRPQDTPNSIWYHLGGDWWIRVDRLDEGSTTRHEIHVYEFKGVKKLSSIKDFSSWEKGLFKDVVGWIDKHGKPAQAPKGLTKKL